MLRVTFLSSFGAHQNYYDKYAGNQEPRQKEGLKIYHKTKLSDIVEVEKARILEATTIASLWASHFEKIPFAFGLSVPDSVYTKWIGERARQNPTFIIPLTVGSGIRNIVAQHQIDADGRTAVMFTPLDEYQRYNDCAPIRMLSLLFDDYIHDKQLCLIKTEFDGSLLTRDQATKILRSCIGLYFADDSYQFVQRFNHSPHAFDYAIFNSFYQAKFSPKFQ